LPFFFINLIYVFFFQLISIFTENDFEYHIIPVLVKNKTLDEKFLNRTITHQIRSRRSSENDYKDDTINVNTEDIKFLTDD
jgi:hypothetical protein